MPDLLSEMVGVQFTAVRSGKLIRVVHQASVLRVHRSIKGSIEGTIITTECVPVLSSTNWIVNTSIEESVAHQILIILMGLHLLLLLMLESLPILFQLASKGILRTTRIIHGPFQAPSSLSIPACCPISSLDSSLSLASN